MSIGDMTEAEVEKLIADKDATLELVKMEKGLFAIVMEGKRLGSAVRTSDGGWFAQSVGGRQLTTPWQTKEDVKKWFATALLYPDLFPRFESVDFVQ